MAKKLIMLKGLPASGKSTWAKEQREAVRLNMDDFRMMLHDGVFTKGREKITQGVYKAAVEEAMETEVDVIVDNTHFHPKWENYYKELCPHYGYKFEIKDFTEVPLSKCLKRDRERAKPVGDKVIMDMYNRYIKKAPERLYDPSLPPAIMVDIDGTIAHMEGRSPYEWHRVDEDKPDMNLFPFLDTLSGDNNIIYMSGRDSTCRPQTEHWLEYEQFPSGILFMRAEKDNRKDSVVKKELYEENVKGKYNVICVLDDRKQVVDMWRNECNLKCLQVEDGDF